MSKQVVTLKLFYGVLSYDASGKVTSKNEPVKIIHKSAEWDNFLEHMVLSGISKAEVTKVFDLDSKKESDESEVKEIQEEVNAYFKEIEVALSPEQKQIKELQAQIDELKNPKPTEAKVNKAAQKPTEAK